MRGVLRLGGLLSALLGALLGVLCAPIGSRAEWPAFRGPMGIGVATDGEIPLAWSETEHVAWKLPLSGYGWSQPVTAGDVIYLTTAVGEGLDPPKTFRGGLMDARSRPRVGPPAPAGKIAAEVEWQVIAVDLPSGEIRWTKTAARGRPAESVHPSNTYASETPVADERGVVAYFGAIGLVVAFDATGERRWERRLGEPGATFQNLGTASSLAALDDAVFVQCFHEREATLICLDAAIGDERWRVARQTPGTSWSSPLVWRNDLRKEVVATGQKLVTSHDPQTGAELWRVTGIEAPSSSSPAASRAAIYFGQRTPFANGPLFALPTGLSGEHRPEGPDQEIPARLWSRKASAPGLSSPVCVGGYVYALHSSVLHCYDAATGARTFKSRLPKMGPAVASLTAVGDRILILDEDGRALVVKAGPVLEVIGAGKLDDTFWASPAVTGKGLLLRGVKSLYCVR